MYERWLNRAEFGDCRRTDDGSRVCSLASSWPLTGSSPVLRLCRNLNASDDRLRDQIVMRPRSGLG